MSGWAQPGRVARPGPGPWQDGNAYVHDRGWQRGGETAAGGLAGARATLSPQSAHPPAAALARQHRGAADAERSGPGAIGRRGRGQRCGSPVAAPGRRASAPAPPPPRGDRAPHVSPGESAAQGSELPAEAPQSPGGGCGTQRSGGRGDDAGARELLAANPPAASLLNSEG